jgi:hypothetical protein
MMKHNEKRALMQQFITEWLLKKSAVSTVDEPFHEAFYQEFGGKRKETTWGAQPVVAAMKLLGEMRKQGILERSSVGLPGGEGFPSWVYCYDLPANSPWRMI